MKYLSENDSDFEQNSYSCMNAHLKIKGVINSHFFNRDGSRVETEIAIPYKEMAIVVLMAIVMKHANAPINEVEHMLSASKSELYDVEFKKKARIRDVMY